MTSAERADDPQKKPVCRALIQHSLQSAGGLREGWSPTGKKRELLFPILLILVQEDLASL